MPQPPRVLRFSVKAGPRDGQLSYTRSCTTALTTAVDGYEYDCAEGEEHTTGEKVSRAVEIEGCGRRGRCGRAGWNVRAVREVRLDGYGARIFQHEFDHLEGTMYTDRIVDEGKMFEMEEEDNT